MPCPNPAWVSPLLQRTLRLGRMAAGAVTFWSCGYAGAHRPPWSEGMQEWNPEPCGADARAVQVQKDLSRRASRACNGSTPGKTRMRCTACAYRKYRYRNGSNPPSVLV